MRKTLIPHDFEGNVVPFARLRKKAYKWMATDPFYIKITSYETTTLYGVPVVKLETIAAGIYYMRQDYFINDGNRDFSVPQLVKLARYRGVTTVEFFKCHHTANGQPASPKRTIWSANKMLSARYHNHPTTTEEYTEPFTALMKLERLHVKRAILIDTVTSKLYPMMLGGPGGYRDTVNSGRWDNGMLPGNFCVRQYGRYYQGLVLQDCPCRRA